MEQPARFRDVYEMYSDMVYNLCLNYLQNREDAEEATQDVFVKVYDKLSAFRSESSLKTWIYRIAVNHCHDKVKSRKRIWWKTLLTLDNGPERAEFARFDHPGVQLEDREALELLYRQINALPEQQKTAIILRYLEDLSPPEIAAIMSLSVKAVESLLQRGKLKLQE